MSFPAANSECAIECVRAVHDVFGHEACTEVPVLFHLQHAQEVVSTQSSYQLCKCQKLLLMESRVAQCSCRDPEHGHGPLSRQVELSVFMLFRC